ncbi:MAG: methyltransferase domain-containing protein [Clostridia bacterium]|nr:methyltransferase domain-containing protein [Clostridia bacterium]
MSGYQEFSEFYDLLMQNVDYAARADYLLSLFEKHGSKPASVLDIACGSGNLCAELVRRGVDTVGVDASEAMLAKAVEKLPEALWLCQDMREMDLYGTVDGAVCILDSLNHLCRTADIAQVFRRTRLFVEPGGLFIFDVNTPYKHREVLADRSFVVEEEGVLCVWRNRYLPHSGEVAMLLDFFVEDEDGRYERYWDTVRERAYSERTLRRLLAETGWETLAVYEDMTEEMPTAECQRMVFVARSTRTVAEASGKIE